MELKETIELMNSSDWVERFKAEYFQAKIRQEKLHQMIVKAQAGTLGFKPNCPLELLREQEKCMGAYIQCLEIRSEIEGIKLD